jgi:hypothetical protein
MKFREFFFIVLALQTVNACVIYALLLHCERIAKLIH